MIGSVDDGFWAKKQKYARYPFVSSFPNSPRLLKGAIVGNNLFNPLESRLRAVNFSVVGADKADATTKAKLNSIRKNNSRAPAQAAQDAIDPFRGAVLTCP